jgi:NitT/TauT family transport system substrate-binding protein
MVKERPATVKKFIEALMAAWEASLNPANQQKTMETLLKFDKNTAPDIQLLQLEATRPLIKPSPRTRIGAIDADAWKQTEAIMLKQQQIRKAVHVEKVLYPVQ